MALEELGLIELQVESWSNSTRVVEIRGATETSLINRDHTTNADRSRASETFQLDSEPIFLNASPAVAPVRRGELYIRLSLLVNGQLVTILATGYATDSKALTLGVQEGFTEGPGLVYTVTTVNPAAGAELTHTVPTNARWKLKSLRARLITDATSINRHVKLVFNDGLSDFYKRAGGLDHVASTTVDYGYAQGISVEQLAVIVNDLVSVLPEIVLFQGWVVSTSTSNLQAGDNWDVGLLQVEEWIEE